jgi:hypothetical protein
MQKFFELVVLPAFAAVLAGLFLSATRLNLVARGIACLIVLVAAFVISVLYQSHGNAPAAPATPPAAVAAASPSNPQPSASGASPSIPGCVFISETPAYLMHLGEDLMSVQRDRLIAPYIGKCIRLSGQIDDIGQVSGLIFVYFSSTALFGHRLEFDKAKWADRLLLLSKGTNITAACKIAQIYARRLILDNCELESIEGR